MKNLIVLVFSLSFFLPTHGKEIKYPAHLIPDSLKEDAFAVIRNEEKTYEVISLNETHTSIIHTITILNPNGKKQAWDYFLYSNNKKINRIKINIYNALGILEDVWYEKNFDDVALDPFGSSYTDTRALTARPISNDYPFTVEYIISYTENNTFNTVSWYPSNYNNVAVEKSSFKYVFPEGFNYSIAERNLPDQIKKNVTKNSVEYKLINAKARKQEPYSPFKEEYLPHVNVTAETFKYDDFQGTRSSWKDFGNFIAQLNEGRDILDEESIAKIMTISDTCNTEKEKIQALYKYMQNNTRYISIQIGIGGWQPTPAQTVAETGYGDCKALSNYMMSLLKYAGITSYYTLVKAKEFNYYFDTAYVSNQFNHAILCVPQKNDTIWLECTSQTAPFGYIGSFTDNRNVLIITPEGGVMSKTPLYSKFHNHRERIAEVNLDLLGNCEVTLETTYSGLEYDDMHWIYIEDEEERLKKLYKNYDMPNFTIKSFNLGLNNETPPVLSEELDIELSSYASKSGTRMFLPVNPISKRNNVPKKVTERKLPIQKKYEATYNDTVNFTIPAEYEIEVMPSIPEIDNKYGKYSARIEKTGDGFLYTRHLEINKGIFPAPEYEDYIDFYKQIKNNDNSLIVLKKK